MECYAIGVKFEKNELTWSVSKKNRFAGFFISGAITQYQAQAAQIIKNIDVHTQHHLEGRGYHIHIHRFEEDYCVIVTNEELSNTALYHLAANLIKYRMSLQTVLEDISYHSQDLQIKKIKVDLNDTHDLMHNNIDKVLERGERIEDLLVQTEGLKVDALRFQHKAEDLNRCMPRCTII